MFDPFGYTCLILLSESHLAIHTFPERGKAYIELTSCVHDPFYRFISLHDCETTCADGGGDVFCGCGGECSGSEVIACHDRKSNGQT